MAIVNYTPQDVNLHFRSGSEGFAVNARPEESGDHWIVRVISRSGRVCTVRTCGAHEDIFRVSAGDFVICAERPAEPIGIDWQGPEPAEDAEVIVSIVAAPQVAVLRPDLRVLVPDTGPDTVIRNEKGDIVGVTRLIDWSVETKVLPGLPTSDGTRAEYFNQALNMTPHDVRSISERGDLTIHKCGQVPRVRTRQDYLGLGLFEVVRSASVTERATGIGTVSEMVRIPLSSRPVVHGLDWNGPEPATDQVIIVSLLAAPEIVRARPDLRVLVPDTGPGSVIRNEDGSIRGVSRFVRHSRYSGERFVDLAFAHGGRLGWPESPKGTFYLALVIGANPTGEYADMLTLASGFASEEAAGGSGAVAHTCAAVTAWNREAGTNFGPLYLCQVGQMASVRSFDVEK